MGRTASILLLAGAVWMAAAAPLAAHHSISAEFDTNKPISFKGTIKKVEDSFNFLWRVEHARSFARRGVAGACRRIAAAENLTVHRRGSGVPRPCVITRPRISVSLVINGLRFRRRRAQAFLVIQVRSVACAIGQIGGRRIGRLRHRGGAQQGHRQSGDKRCTEHCERLHGNRFAPLPNPHRRPLAGFNVKDKICFFCRVRAALFIRRSGKL